MEIEKLIEQLKRHDGVWCSIPIGERLITKVTITLKQLQAENGRLRAELEQLKQERAAAVNDYRVLPEKCVCMTTCGGKKIAIVLDVEVMKETAHD